MPKETQVSDVEEVEVPDEGTPDESGVGEQEHTTPESQQPVDVESLRAEYEAKLQTYQKDLNQLKSSLQSREATLTKQYEEQKKHLEKQLRETRMQGMDETQRKQYEAQLATEEYQNLQTQLEELNTKNREMASMLDAQQFFLSRGVPADKLVLNQGYDALVNSGWAIIDDELARYRGQGQQSKQPNQPARERKRAPEVVTDKGSPGSKTTWKELISRYGSAENVYQMVENGTLDPSIIPG